MEAQDTNGRPQRVAEAPKRDTKIKGLILAAGRGSRLGTAADSVPKCLLEVGRRCLVEHQLDALADAGVGPTALVLGYAADEVRETVGIRAEYVFNKRWNRTNSLYSFWLAREWLDGPVIIMNSDVLFSPEVLERLLEVEGDAIAIDTSSGQSREQMSVRVIDGRLVDMRKDLPSEDVHGENVGILKLSAETVQVLLEEAQRQIDGGNEQSWLGTAVREIASRRPLSVVDVRGLPWVEIDFATDLARARKEVWPRIKRATWKHHRALRLALWATVPLLVGGLPLGIQMSLPDPPQPSWEVLEPHGHEGHAVRLGEQGMSWWPVDAETGTSFRVRGPGPVRIDSRLLDPVPDHGQYVVEVDVDGQRVDWFKFDTKPSVSVTHAEWVIGKRKRISLDLDDGLHDIDVRLVAPTTGRCLLRLRTMESPLSD